MIAYLLASSRSVCAHFMHSTEMTKVFFGGMMMVVTFLSYIPQEQYIFVAVFVSGYFFFNLFFLFFYFLVC